MSRSFRNNDRSCRLMLAMLLLSVVALINITSRSARAADAEYKYAGTHWVVNTDPTATYGSSWGASDSLTASASVSVPGSPSTGSIATDGSQVTATAMAAYVWFGVGNPYGTVIGSVTGSISGSVSGYGAESANASSNLAGLSKSVYVCGNASYPPPTTRTTLVTVNTGGATQFTLSFSGVVHANGSCYIQGPSYSSSATANVSASIQTPATFDAVLFAGN